MTQPDRNISATCALLRDLLTHDPRYRRHWRTKAERRRSELSQAAVARVVESYLVDSGERGEFESAVARQLKDRVSRALTGTALSAQTLGWLIAAFNMDENDKDRLFEIFSGQENSRTGISHTLRRRRAMVRNQCHRTVSLFERYAIAMDGSLVGRRTLHTIRAVQDGVDIYIFNHEPQASCIKVIHGGRVGQSFAYGDGLSSAEIVLDKPLLKAETTALEYQANFIPGTVRPTEVRRAAFARSENVDLAIEFEGRVPQAAWWCIWDDQIDGGRIWEERVNFQGNAVRQYVPFIEETVVGFRWEW
ncbi:hypothetical protein [Allokutzneria sp. A3M-2-11 16]|uniref:hypothetical protein n=1 Tax=Allokutzneria sp. A3M-2-11 16 TaxID=2962043 RepID=UPI0020B803F4|nr:hypothetical protein [Allokutzneria sp. A3M-2-11 16]